MHGRIAGQAARLLAAIFAVSAALAAADSTVTYAAATAYLSAETIVYTDADNEPNDVAVVRAGTKLTITETGADVNIATVDAGGGACAETPADSNRVECNG